MLSCHRDWSDDWGRSVMSSVDWLGFSDLWDMTDEVSDVVMLLVLEVGLLRDVVVVVGMVVIVVMVVSVVEDDVGVTGMVDGFRRRVHGHGGGFFRLGNDWVGAVLSLDDVDGLNFMDDLLRRLPFND